jgi:uncharacterized membrane protein YesL
LRPALRAIGEALRAYEGYAWLYIQANLLAVLLMIPIVTAPAAYAALIYLAHTQQIEKTITLNEFWHGFRHNFGRHLLLGMINAGVIGILYVNFSSYAPGQGVVFVFLRAAWAIILLLWLCVQLYAWPLLLLMDSEALSVPRLVLTALRNAALMLFKNPIYTLTLMIVIVLWAAFCSVLLAPVVMFLFAMVANLAVVATRDRLNAG